MILVFIALVISNLSGTLGGTKILDGNIQPLFDHQTVLEDSNWGNIQTKYNDYQNNPPLNGKNSISGIDDIVPIEEEGCWIECDMDTYTGSIGGWMGYGYDLVLPEIMLNWQGDEVPYLIPVKVTDDVVIDLVIDDADGDQNWYVTIDVKGGYVPTPLPVEEDEDAGYYFDMNGNEAYDEGVDVLISDTADWFALAQAGGIYGIITISTKGELGNWNFLDEEHGQLLLTAPYGYVEPQTLATDGCCEVTYNFGVMVFEDFCLDSNQWPYGSTPWSSQDTIPLKDLWKLCIESAWTGCFDFSQGFTQISVRYHQFPK